MIPLIKPGSAVQTNETTSPSDASTSAELSLTASPRTATLNPRPPTRYQRGSGPFAVVDFPQIVHAGEATYLESSELVLGLTLNGESRAYPIRMTWYHHIINDELGGIPVLVTF